MRRREGTISAKPASKKELKEEEQGAIVSAAAAAAAAAITLDTLLCESLSGKGKREKIKVSNCEYTSESLFLLAVDHCQVMRIIIIVAGKIVKRCTG